MAGGRVIRMLRALLVTAGLAALGWLLVALFATGTAAADETPTAPAEHASTGSGLLGLVTGVVETATGTAGQLTAPLLDTADSALAPVVDPPPDTAEPAPTPVERVAPPAVPTAAPVTAPPVPLARPEPVAAPRPEPAAPEPSVRPRPIVQDVGDEIGEAPIDRADRSDPNRTPGKAPTAPAAPALPTSTVSAGHDGPGTARGGPGVLAAQPGLVPPAAALSRHTEASDAGGQSPGLPALSPD